MTFSGSTKANTQALAGTDIDLSLAEFFTKSISANTTFTFSNPTASKGLAFTVELTISGGAVDTWPASVGYDDGVQLVLGNGRHALGFISYNGGTDWVMSVIASNIS